MVEIFTYLQHNDRLKMALVCKKWFKFERSRRFDLNFKRIKDASELHEFLNSFKEYSMSLPIQCIKFNSKIFEDILPAKVNQFNEIFIKHSNVEVEVETNVELSKFKNVVEKIPITVKKVIWEWNSSTGFYQDYEKHWITICNAVKRNEIKVVMHFHRYTVSNCKIKMFQIMSKNPLKNITIENVSFRENELNLFSDEGQFNCLNTCKTLSSTVTKPYHLQIFNYVGKNNLTKLTLVLKMEIRNFMEYLLDLENLEVSVNTYFYVA